MNKIILSFLILLTLSLNVFAKDKSYDSNKVFSQELRQRLKIDPLTWDYGENPVMSFAIDKDGRVRNIDYIKKRDRGNAKACASDLVSFEPYALKYRNFAYVFECKPALEISRKEFKDIKKYLKKYFKQVDAKIRANWYEDPRKYQLRTLTSFDLYKDGSVRNIKVHDSSGDDDFDQLTTKIIQKSAPFSRIDDKAFLFAQDKQKINIIFDFDNYRFYQRRRNASVGFGLGYGGFGYGRPWGYGGGFGYRRPWGAYRAWPYYCYPYW